MRRAQHYKPASDNYLSWKTRFFVTGDLTLKVATKPGLRFFDHPDPAADLLAEHMDLTGAARMLDLNCGPGVVGACAAVRAPATRVVLVDRNIVAVEAARRTLELNNVKNATACFGNGTNNVTLIAKIDLVTIRLPKGRLPTLQLIWDAFHALAIGGRCYLAGGNDEGIRSALSRFEEIFGTSTVLGYQRGSRIAVATKMCTAPVDRSAFETKPLDHPFFHEFRVEVRGFHVLVRSRPGVFAWDRLDEGSRVLIEHMKIASTATVLELGCGNGVVGVVAAKLAPRGHVYLVDADFEAVRSAEETVRINETVNCTVMPGDAIQPVSDLKFDVVVTNPPFHIAHRAELRIAIEFIRGAASMLRPNGRLFVVANRTLPYEPIFEQHFRRVDCIYSNPRYKVLEGSASEHATLDE